MDTKKPSDEPKLPLIYRVLIPIMTAVGLVASMAVSFVAMFAIPAFLMALLYYAANWMGLL